MAKSRSLKQSEEKGLRALRMIWLSIPIGIHGFPGVTGTALGCGLRVKGFIISPHFLWGLGGL